MASLFRLFLLALVLALGQATPAAADKRVALVVGNGAYQSSSMRLPNPPRDAALISDALKRLGFDVETVADADKEAMEDAVVRLAMRGRDADITLFFYAGHALQDVDGKNYLMPVDGALKVEQDLRRRFVRLDDVLADLSRLQGARIVVLDACRDNEAVEALRAALPASRSAGLSRGLAAVPRISGMLVAFATQPDRVAADGQAENSPFTKSLAARLVEPGVELRTVLTRVRQDVALATNHAQVPEVSDSLIGEVYLRQAEQQAPAPLRETPAPPSNPDLAAETAFWSSVEKLDTRADYEAYLSRFGKGGFYALLAERKIAEFDKTARASAGQQAALPQPQDVPKPPPLRPDVDSDPDVAECDRLAAHPSDTGKPKRIAGVQIWAIDAAEAVNVCARAAGRFPEMPRLDYQLGRALDAKNDHDEARRRYELSAEKGYPAAMNNLGNLYAQGEGVRRDYAQAHRWYEKAAERGYAAAMNNLGNLYADGEGVAHNPVEALRWYERAAELGIAAATNNIGLMHLRGYGVALDRDRGCELFRRAAALGEAMAASNVKRHCEPSK